MRIACVGGGPAGLYFAVAMKVRDPGHEITVYERGPAAGWGVTFGPALLRELHRTDPVSAERIELASFRWAGQIALVRGERLHRPDGDGYSIGRERLLGILADRAVALGVRIESGQDITAPPPDADLVVACDGANSRLRSGGAFGTRIRDSTNRHMWLGASKVFPSFSYLFTRTEHGWVWAYAYGIDATSSTFVVECTTRTWRGLGFGEMSPADCGTELEKIFADHLDGAQLSGHTGRWQTFRTIHNEAWHHGTLVLAGDAAHTTHFTIGSGTTLAIQDAIVLATSLHSFAEMEAALWSYQRRREAALRRPVADADLSARWFENIDRYVELGPRQFETLLHARRSPLLPSLPPRLFYQVHQVTEALAPLRELRGLAGNAARAAFRNQR